MDAVRIHGPGDIRLESILRPVAGPFEVLLEITAAGFCGTDAGLFRHGPSIVQATAAAEWPIVLGHEFSGRVAEVGEGVEELAVGDLVACGAGVSCGHCRFCREGRTNLCVSYWTAGIHRDGGLAEACAVPAKTCELVTPHGVEGDAIGLAQPMAIAHHSVLRGDLAAGDQALVIGAGGIGAFAVWICNQLGAEVTVCDRDPARLQIAETLGASRVVLVDDIPLLDLLAEAEEFDVAYEMTGAAEPLAVAVASVRAGGKVVAVGLQVGQPPVDMSRLTLKELDLLGPSAHVKAVDLPRALDLLAARPEGWADVAPRVLSLADLVERGLPDLVAGKSSAIKTLVDPRSPRSRPFDG